MTNLTIDQIEAKLKAKKAVWTSYAMSWSDFSEDFDDGRRRHVEAVEHDFNEGDDIVDQIEATEENAELIARAEELRTEYRIETLVALDLA